MFLIAFAFAWVFFIVHTKGYPNYVPFSTSTHALLSARTTHSRDFVLRTLLWKAPLDHHPRAPLPSALGPHLDIISCQGASFTHSLASPSFSPGTTISNTKSWFPGTTISDAKPWCPQTSLSCFLGVSPSGRSFRHKVAK